MNAKKSHLTQQARTVALLDGHGSAEDVKQARSEFLDRAEVYLKSARTLEQRKAESKANLEMLASGNLNFITTGEK